jgi:hypothetical protein
LAFLLGVSSGSVRDILAYCREQGKALPCRRGTDVQAIDGSPIQPGTRARAKQGLLGTVLGRRSRCLLDLSEVGDGSGARVSHAAGTRSVPIHQIHGSESRPGDFDREFNPLHDINRARWLSVAGARLRGRALPPVALVQVGDGYFVRDGHHRISVARALSQTAVEATVEVWQVDGPLPWDTPTGRPRGVKGAVAKAVFP